MPDRQYESPRLQEGRSRKPATVDTKTEECEARRQRSDQRQQRRAAPAPPAPGAPASGCGTGDCCGRRCGPEMPPAVLSGVRLRSTRSPTGSACGEAGRRQAWGDLRWAGRNGRHASGVPRTEGSMRVAWRGGGRGLPRGQCGPRNRDRGGGCARRGFNGAYHRRNHGSRRDRWRARGRGRDRFGRSRGGCRRHSGRRRRRRGGRGHRRRSGRRRRKRLVDRRLDGRDRRGRDLVHLVERALHLGVEAAERRRRRVCAPGACERGARARRDGENPGPRRERRSSNRLDDPRLKAAAAATRRRRAARAAGRCTRRRTTLRGSALRG